MTSPDGEIVYVPRHAIGAEGRDAWWGAPTVDALVRKTGKPLAPPHMRGSPANVGHTEEMGPPQSWMAGPGRIPAVEESLLQPRAAVYRRKTDTLLVASEGTDNLVELDALAPDPSFFVRAKIHLAMNESNLSFAILGGAPTGIALSEDEDTAYVFCRSTFDLAKVDLKTEYIEWLRLADDGLPGDAAKGRRLFTNATSSSLSGGLGCAACHPEGRDDGWVWRESLIDSEDEESGAVFLGLRTNMKEPFGHRKKDVEGGFSWVQRMPGDPPLSHKYYPRQTPMLAGRARSAGPYGWHAEASTLMDRMRAGFRLHRAPWEGNSGGALPDITPYSPVWKMADAIGDYVQSGLLPPPVVEHPLTDAEKRGQATLADLIKNNGSRMGHTDQLGPEDQAALVAYLETL